MRAAMAAAAALAAVSVPAGCGGVAPRPGPLLIDPVAVYLEKGRVSEDGLAVSLRVRNTDPARRMHWHKAHEGAALTDEHGNRYGCIRMTPRRFVDPGEAVDCQVTFETPVPQARRFLLTLAPDVADGFGGWSRPFERPAAGFPSGPPKADDD